MDQDRLTQIGRKPLVDEMQTVLQLFPASDSSLKTQEQSEVTSDEGKVDNDTIISTAAVDKVALANTLAYMNKMGIDSLVGFSVSQDLKDPSKNVLQLSEGGLGLPSKDYYKEKGTTDEYQDTVHQMFALVFGPEQQPENTITTADAAAVAADAGNGDTWSEVARDVVDFETQLADIGTELNDLYDPIKSYNPTAIDELDSLTPSIDWSAYLKNTLPSSVTAPKEAIVSSPDYLTRLESLLQKTPPNTLQYFFAWKLIQGRASSLGPEYQQPLRNLNSVLSGSNAAVIPDRWKHCVKVVDGSLGEMIGHYFIQEAFNGDSKAQATSIINSLLKGYGKVIPKLSWLDKATAAGATKKLKAIVALVGYSTTDPDVTDSKSVQDHYKDLKVNPTDFYGNQVGSNIWATERDFMTLNKPVNKKVMGSPPQTINAFYSPSNNQIYFPAGILQPPFFHSGNPEYVNYGALGVVAGHEITVSFFFFFFGFLALIFN